MPPPSDDMTGPAFLGRGFRPFFLLAACHAAGSLLLWAGFFAGHAQPQGIFADPVLWHAHEMIYGFVMAVVAGFLLTAVANWTGGAPVRQGRLLLLMLLWITGRVAVHADALPLWMAALADCAFILALAVMLAIPLVRTRNMRNFIFLGLLAALLAGNAAFYATQEKGPLHAALFIILMMISLVAGRIVPSFTVAALRGAGLPVRQQDQLLLDRLCLVSMIALVAAVALAGISSPITGVCAAAAAVCNLLRLRRYHVLPALKHPMLWILHAGYGWLVLGLGLLAFSCFGYGQATVALHALTAGCVGSMCLGMMCRVTLGHTGRHISARPPTVAAFAILQAAAVLRTAGPALLPDHYANWIILSGLLWSASFALYLFSYAPMLVKPRPDGLPA